MEAPVPTISGNGGSTCSFFGIDPSLPGEEATIRPYSNRRESYYSTPCPNSPHPQPGNRANLPPCLILIGATTPAPGETPALRHPTDPHRARRPRGNELFCTAGRRIILSSGGDLVSTGRRKCLVACRG